VTLGLVLTELLINSNKHAYGGGPGPIEVKLIKDRVHLHLIEADGGAGKVSSRKGFGSRGQRKRQCTFLRSSNRTAPF
jgi:two-component sensor histidine kinase